MFEAITEVTFEAAHMIPGHPKCGRLHGHSYRVVVCLQSETLKSDFPFVEDFGPVKEVLNRLVPDHTFINEELAWLGTPDQPFVTSAENLARFFYRNLRDSFPNLVAWVEVWEGYKNRARYSETHYPQSVPFDQLNRKT